MRAPLPPDRAPDAVWKQRYRRPSTYWLEVARRDRSRALLLGDATGVAQAYALDLRSGDVRQVTDAPAGSVFVRLSSDGRSVLSLQDHAGDEVGHWAARPFEGGAPVDLTPTMDPYSAWEIATADDGTAVALAISDDDGTSLWVCAASGQGTPRQLCSWPGIVRSMTFTADGAVVVAQTSGPTGSSASAIVAVDLMTGEEIATLWDGSPSSMGAPVTSPIAGDPRVASTSNVSGRDRPAVWDLVSGARRDLDLPVDGDAVIMDWSDDGRRVLVGVADRAVETLWTFDLDTGKAEQVPTGHGSVLDGAAFGLDGVVVLRRRSTEPATVISIGPDGERSIVADPDAPPAAPWRSVSFPSSDATEIQAWLVTPAAAGPHPTVVHVHGGPESATTEQYAASIASWVDHGYAVALLNYRGSTTFGRDYQQAIWKDFGHWEIEDLAATAAWLVDEGIAVPRGLVLTGGSYGGYLTLLGLGRLPGLWAGGVAHVAVGDWARMYEESAAMLRAYEEQMFGGPPDANPDLYRRASPITYVADIEAPMLVFQGSNDTRCPPGQFRAFEEAARAAGKRIEVEWFDAGHIGPNIEQSIAFQERTLAFTAELFAGFAA